MNGKYALNIARRERENIDEASEEMQPLSDTEDTAALLMPAGEEVPISLPALTEE